MGTSKRLLLCGELQDDVIGTAIESRFFRNVRALYETSVSRIIEKFPFSDETIKYLGFLDPCSRNNSPPAGVIKLATQFTSFTEEEMDNLLMELQDFRASSDDQLPPFHLDEPAAIDNFWVAMGEVKLVTDLCTLRLIFSPS